MSKSVKAVLLSALVFPGAGHLFLKKHIFGAILICASFAGLYMIVSNMIDRVQEILEKVERGEVGLDVVAISELVSRQLTGNGSQLLDLAWSVLIICWIIGMADSYRCGRAQDKSDMDL